MIKVTPSAAQQIRVAATQSESDEMGLRIAARRDGDGSVHYAMGFDEARNDDLVVTSEGSRSWCRRGRRGCSTG